MYSAAGQSVRRAVPIAYPQLSLMRSRWAIVVLLQRHAEQLEHKVFSLST